jgi:hypothetical protein
MSAFHSFTPRLELHEPYCLRHGFWHCSCGIWIVYKLDPHCRVNCPLPSLSLSADVMQGSVLEVFPATSRLRRIPHKECNNVGAPCTLSDPSLFLGWNCRCVLNKCLSFWQGPKAEDRAQVASKEVKLPNSAPTILDNQDAQIVRFLFCLIFLVGIIHEYNHKLHLASLLYLFSYPGNMF